MSNMEKNYEDFEALLNEYMPVNEEEKVRGKVVGKIISKDRNYSYLEVDGQSMEVRVRSEELTDYNVGDEVEVMTLGKIEEDETLFLIGSRRRIENELGKEKIKESFEKQEVLKGKIKRVIKGGYIVEVYGQQCFLPNSLSEINMEDGEKFVGKDVEIVVKEIKEDKRGNKVLVSRKDVVISKEKEVIETLNIGDVLEVEVTEILDFGLTVKVKGVRGFIHISEIDWKKTTDLQSKYKVGDKLEAKIIEIEKDKRNVKLSIKELKENPWEILASKHNVGDVVEGKVTRVLNYGAFIEIIPGIEGLIHMNDLSWTKKKTNINQYMKVGDTVKVSILELDKDNKKLKLGIKQLSENPWDNAEEKYGIGKVVKGKVVEIKNFGIFVEIEEGVDGFIHNSDFTWVGNKRFEKGEEVEFKVIEFNLDEQKIKGSIKALEKSPWEIVAEKYNIGDIVEKEIKNIQSFGLFVKIEDGIDGFIPGKLASKEFIKSLEERFKVGDIVKAEIVEMDNETQKVKLSIRKIEIDNAKKEDKELIEKYGTSSTEE